MSCWGTILTADWSKSVRGREVYRASVSSRTVSRRPPPGGAWTVGTLLEAAQAQSRHGRVLVGIDAPLGVPRAYWEAARAARREWRACASFIEWLPAAVATAGFLDAHTRAADCCVERPFFAPPPGRWSRRDWETAFGLPTLRDAERGSGAKPVFLLRGLPGLAGPAAVDVWRGLAAAMSAPRAFDVWPFEDTGRAVVVAEMYPRALYAPALSAGPPYAALAIAKTKKDVRVRALEALRGAAWVREGRVDLQDLDAARAGEDAFDALLSAAGLLRQALDGQPLARAGAGDTIAEGGILGITS